MRAHTALLLAAVLWTGCLSQPEDPPTDSHQRLLPGFAQDHDHDDVSLHAFGRGLQPIGYHSLTPDTDGTNAADRGDWLSSEIVVRGTTAFVGYIGAPWLLAVADLSDPTRPALAGTLPLANAWAMDVAASDDGAWAFVSVTNAQAVGTLFAKDYALGHTAPPDGPAAPGIAVVDARDPSAPALSSFLPMHGLGPHTAVYHRYPDGREFVFADKAEGGLPGNTVLIAEVVPTPAGGRALEPVATFALSLTDGSTFPHDVNVAEHPITGRTLLYAAYWDDGLVVADVTDPEEPTLVAQFTDYPAHEEVQVHDVHPFPHLVGGRHYTVTAPEIITGDLSGHVRVYDTTDPSTPRLVGGWILPGDYRVDEEFLFSTHNFAFLPDGRIALGHGHAGVWVLDWLGPGGIAAPNPAWIAEPRAVAYHVPHAPGAHAPAWSPVHGVPWVWGTAVDERGLMWAADAMSGLHGFVVP